MSPLVVLARRETHALSSLETAVDGGVMLATQAVSHLAMLGTASAGRVTLVIAIA